MNLNELKKSWVSESNPEIQRRIWDRSADSYRARPLPTFEDNEFLQRIREQMPEMKGKRFLDVGCGAGVYALALAKEGGNALGVDISPRMIEQAKERALTDGIPNAEFDCVNWQDADIDALGYRGAFDVVFAHMTPAVCDFDTFEKLNACSCGVCLVEKPTRRSDVVLDEALSRIGIGDNGKYNSDIENTFSYISRFNTSNIEPVIGFVAIQTEFLIADEADPVRTGSLSAAITLEGREHACRLGQFDGGRLDVKHLSGIETLVIIEGFCLCHALRGNLQYQTD